MCPVIFMPTNQRTHIELTLKVSTESLDHSCSLMILTQFKHYSLQAKGEKGRIHANMQNNV